MSEAYRPRNVARNVASTRQAEAIKRTRKDLTDNRVRLVTLPDERTFAIPADVFAVIFGSDD